MPDQSKDERNIFHGLKTVEKSYNLLVFYKLLKEIQFCIEETY